MNDEHLHDISQRLSAISDELADLAISRLHGAIRGGESTVPLDERRITRARRSIEKAVALLGDAQEGPLEDL